MDGYAEVRRVMRGPDTDEQPQGAELRHFRIRCDGNAEHVLKRAQEVLLVLLHHPSRDSASLRSAVPNWFREACAPAETLEQGRARVEHQRSLPGDQQRRAGAERPWSLDAWLHWFTDEERIWSWWSARVTDPDTIALTLATTDWPAPVAALEWTFRAAGSAEAEFDA